MYFYCLLRKNLVLVLILFVFVNKMYGKNLLLVLKCFVFVNKMYDKVNYRVVFMGIIKFDFMDCKIFVFIN